MKYIGIILLNAFIFSMGCRAQDRMSYWMAVSSNKINGEPMRGVTLSYMEMLVQAQPYIAINGDNILVPYPVERTIKRQDFKSFTNARIRAYDNILLDSISGIAVGKDTLRINFFYQGTGEAEKRFVLNYVPIAKAKYEQATLALKHQRGELIKSMVTWDASALDLNKTRPLYLRNRDAMDLINPMQLADELTQTKGNMSAVYQAAILGRNDSLQRFRTIGIQDMPFSDRIAASIGTSSFDHLEFYVDADQHNQGMAMSQETMANVAMQELFGKISSQLPSSMMKSFGLPKKYDDGDFSGIHTNITLTWSAANKVVTLVIEGIPDVLFDREVDNSVALSAEPTEAEIKKVFTHYLARIDRAKVRVFVMSKDFDELLNRKENRSEIKLPGQLWEYVTSWKYLYELDE
jgi:hypothetical protein